MLQGAQNIQKAVDAHSDSKKQGIYATGEWSQLPPPSPEHGAEEESLAEADSDDDDEEEEEQAITQFTGEFLKVACFML